jgi:hypothetical protein
LLQNDFGPRSEEHFFQIKPEKGILIQESDRSDSNIARFWRSGGYRRLLQHNRPNSDLAGCPSICRLLGESGRCRSSRASSRQPDRRRNGSRRHLRDRDVEKLAYVYFEEEPGRRSAAKLLTRDEARRIATNMAKLPDLLRSGLAREKLAARDRPAT